MSGEFKVRVASRHVKTRVRVAIEAEVEGQATPKEFKKLMTVLKRDWEKVGWKRVKVSVRPVLKSQIKKAAA